MKDDKQKLLIEQVDRKLSVFSPLVNVTVPHKNWIPVHSALKMSLT